MNNGYFHLQLHAFLAAYHPEKLLLLSDQELAAFIDLRAEEAAAAFERSSRSGADVVIASEEANKVLFAGLEFSSYELLKEIIEECYPAYLPLIENRQDKNFTGKLLEGFLPIIARLYDHEGNPKTISAREDLIRELKQYLRKIFI